MAGFHTMKDKAAGAMPACLLPTWGGDSPEAIRRSWWRSTELGITPSDHCLGMFASLGHTRDAAQKIFKILKDLPSSFLVELYHEHDLRGEIMVLKRPPDRGNCERVRTGLCIIYLLFVISLLYCRGGKARKLEDTEL